MSWLVPPEDTDPHTVAEFIEAELIVSGDDYLSFSELRSLMPSGRQLTEEQMLFALAEIEERDRMAGRHYPFFVMERGVGFDSGDVGVLYSFLVLLSVKNSPMRSEGKYSWTDPLFDAVAREAVRAYYGEAARSLVFAWPPLGDRPTTFPEAVRWAAEQLGVGLRAGAEVPTHKQDSGVDVIAWIPFDDGRNGFQITLVQNTVQMSFAKKPRDVVPNDWFLWLSTGTPPTVGFAIPFSIESDDPWWGDIARVATVVFDRRRLISALKNEDPTAWPEWDALRTFVGAEVQRIRELAPPSEKDAPGIVRRRKRR